MEVIPSPGNYNLMEWKEPFSKCMVRIKTIADGNCFFHAILNGFFLQYRQEMVYNEFKSKESIVREFRTALSDKLEKSYETLGGGELKKLGDILPEEFSLTKLKKLLDSSEPVGNQFHQLLSDEINKDIYILDGKNHDIYPSADNITLLYKNRDSIVLVNDHNHYELVGYLHDNGVSTYFTYNHPFIEILRNRLTSKSKR